jgi:CHAD domain-containing protein
MKKHAQAPLEWIVAAAAAARKARRDPRDVDALHRFRVNVRRLTVYLKFIEKTCGITAKPRKRLRRALRATGPLRDTHVSRLWLDDYAALSSSRREEAAILAAELSREGAPAPRRARWWRRIDRDLREARRAVEAAALKGMGFRTERTEKAWRRLSRRLRRLDKIRDQAALHAARIAVKRLRYLLEALDAVPRRWPPPAALRGLQAALGEAHDRDVTAARIARAGRAAGLRAAARHALRRLRLERNASLSRARHYSTTLLRS